MIVVLVAARSVCRAADKVIADKTLVAWVAPSDLAQRGGGVLTLESEGIFDGIVFAEVAPSKWMAGSNMFARTQTGQDGSKSETVFGKTAIQIAIVYRGDQVTIFRNGDKYASYAAKGVETFGSNRIVLMGRRYREAPVENAFFTGWIDDARVYDVALDIELIRALKPNEPSRPLPLAWWDFENGRVADRMNAFSATTLFGDARVENGRLRLDVAGGYLMASRSPPTSFDPASAARSLRENLLNDPHRPGYHFVAPEGRAFPFDPNGCIYWKGRYHLFYIFQDERGHNWGHVSSTDLFHWRHHPTGLVSGMFSGNCFLNKEGRPTICYHQVNQGNAMAVALDDELNTWKKLPTNPITPETQPGDAFHEKYRSWDPYAWLEGDTYYAIFGGKRAAIVKSKSLAGPWSYVGDLLANTVKGVSIDEDVSCADLFKLGNTHVLLCISHDLGARYYLGEWKNEQFHPKFHEKMSWVDHSFFAPESLLDDKGRRIMWSWLLDRPGFLTRMDHGWSGTMSLPRVLTLGKDGTLHMDVPEEIESLRYNGRERTALGVAPDSDLRVAGVSGNSMELAIEMTAPGARQFGVKVLCSAGNEEETRVYYDAVAGKLAVDTTKSSLKEEPKSIEAGPLVLGPGEPLRLRVFVDKSVVEVFANGRQAVMRRVYPSRRDATAVVLFSHGGAAQVRSLRAWDMMPANPH